MCVSVKTKLEATFLSDVIWKFFMNVDMYYCYHYLFNNIAVCISFFFFLKKALFQLLFSSPDVPRVKCSGLEKLICVCFHRVRPTCRSTGQTVLGKRAESHRGCEFQVCVSVATRLCAVCTEQGGRHQ